MTAPDKAYHVKSNGKRNVAMFSKIQIDCRQCGKKYTPWRDRKNDFCSYRCYWDSRKKEIETACAMCGKTVKIKPYHKTYYNNRFCSRHCSSVYRNVSRPRFTRGKVITEHTKKVYGASCAICGYTRFVEYAHIIPHSDGGAFSVDNIIVLCPNHHRLFDHKKLTTEESSLIKPSSRFAKT